VELVPQWQSDDAPNLAILCAVLNEATAYVMRSFLESEGISSQLKIISF
jgi:hypothetical protein